MVESRQAFKGLSCALCLLLTLAWAVDRCAATSVHRQASAGNPYHSSSFPASPNNNSATVSFSLLGIFSVITLVFVIFACSRCVKREQHPQQYPRQNSRVRLLDVQPQVVPDNSQREGERAAATPARQLSDTAERERGRTAPRPARPAKLIDLEFEEPEDTAAAAEEELSLEEQVRRALQEIPIQDLPFRPSSLTSRAIAEQEEEEERAQPKRPRAELFQVQSPVIEPDPRLMDRLCCTPGVSEPTDPAKYIPLKTLLERSYAAAASKEPSKSSSWSPWPAKVHPAPDITEPSKPRQKSPRQKSRGSSRLKDHRPMPPLEEQQEQTSTQKPQQQQQRPQYLQLQEPGHSPRAQATSPSRKSPGMKLKLNPELKADEKPSEAKHTEPDLSRPLNQKELLALDTGNMYEFVLEHRDLPTHRGDYCPTDARMKNRYPDLLPIKSTAVHLSTAEAGAPESYINANYIRGFGSAEKYYIATQGPMESTAEDFWQMVWDQSAEIVVNMTLLTEKRTPKCHRYWPGKFNGDINRADRCQEDIDARQRHGPFSVTTKHCECVDKTFVYTLLELTSKDHSSECRNIHHFWYVAWADHSVPESMPRLIDFIQEVNSKHRAEQPLIVHCSAGIGRTGCFIALDIGFQQLQQKQRVDVKQTVADIRQDRSGLVQTTEQYAMLYNCLKVRATQLQNRLDKIISSSKVA